MKLNPGRGQVPWLLAAGLLAAAPAPAAVPAGAAAEILTLQGAGDQRPAGHEQWSPAQVAQPLAAGDFVRTREAARMALLFADQTQVRLHQNTVLQVKAVASPARPLTSILLEIGRAWAQTRRPPASRLELHTPTATAGIRGTDWDIEVDRDGRTLLTVLSGSVTLSNAQGEITVGSNQAALAEAGKPPVRIQLSQPRDRVQWVNALAADPLRMLPPQDVPPALADARAALARRDLPAMQRAIEAARGHAGAAWVATFEAAREILAQRSDLAAARLRATLAAGDAPPAAYALLADVQTVDGEHAEAQSTLAAGLRRFPGVPQLRAQAAHVLLLAGRLRASAQALAPVQAGDPAVLWLERGALARREGDAAGTLAAYTQATRLAPDDDRGWFGLGSAHTEREDSVPARAALDRALQLNPHGPGYRGELGTLETFRHSLRAAGAAFDAALADNPADYVALTGRGLLRVKQGEPAAALDDFLRAGVMEPRYARARTYTAVAYWQLGRREDALVTLRQAAALDDKDPVPWLFLAQVYADLFRAGEAVQAAREAGRRMPYLKSLNQLASDQQGRASLGASLAFFGMEDWAFELAHEGEYPYWGGSHLFLADRYPGEFNKNSELFQGFLADPLAFGGSPRFSTLLQRPGAYGVAGFTFDHDAYRLRGPSLAVNGLVPGETPVAFFAKAQGAAVRRLPVDLGLSREAFDGRAGVGTVAIGARPTERLGTLLYLTQTDIRLSSQRPADLFGDGTLATGQIDNTTRQATFGLSYRWSPTAQTWLKFGSGTDRSGIDGLQSRFANELGAGALGLVGSLAKRTTDVQLRHTFDPDGDSRLAFGVEHVRERQSNQMAGAGPVQLNVFGLALPDTMVFSGFNEIRRRFSALTLAGERQLGPDLRLDAALAANWLPQDVHGENRIGFLALGAADRATADQRGTGRSVTPRLGVVVRPRPGLTLRTAYQDWVRPLSVSTLNPVHTAGIPVEDRLVEAGGRQRRLVAQVAATLGERTFVATRLDHLRVANPVSPGVDLRTPSLPFLEELRNAQVVNLSTADLIEAAPSFQRGTVRAATLAVNHMFTPHVSGHLKLLRMDTSSSDDAAATAGGKQIPYLPRSTVALGATLASASRVYLSGRLVHRGRRFEDPENLVARPAGTTLDLMGFWETADKRWVIGAAALNLLGATSDRQSRRLLLDARYRF
ncbi:TonB-dependent receptor domain-containing protein [Ramlibacter sp.]|uniref:TonB-dependent receptor domain-containing protein n=1 Tax=Ramlibacter sp. TaxID=1917967 RepID=UPI002C6883AA|nr:TonB-dependent receptor [Ramlibacter sp.]HWI82508.1 TonB-dependent receptor [Ramlibacter sp.]